MKFTIEKEKLLKVLQLVLGVVEKRQTLPILSHILLQLTDDALLVTATDLEMTLISKIALDSENIHEKGSVTVSVKKLVDICRSLPEGAWANIEEKKDKLILKSDNSHFTLMTLPVADFPNLAQNTYSYTLNIPQSLLKKLLNRISFSMAEEDIRYYLNGVSFDFLQGRLLLVAADGHRLSMAIFDLPSDIEQPIRVVIPKKGIIELLRLLEEKDEVVTIMIGANHICVQTSGFVFTSKLIDAHSPDYSSAISKTGDKCAYIDRVALKKALTRVSILSHEKHKGIRFLFSPQLLHLSANNSDWEEAQDDLVIEYEGGEIEIGFNATYLLDICQALSSDRLKMIFSSEKDELIIEGMDEGISVTYVVMPLDL